MIDFGSTYQGSRLERPTQQPIFMRGEVLRVDQRRGVLRIRSRTGKVYDDVRTLAPSSSLTGTGMRAIPQAGSLCIMAVFESGMHREAFVVGTYAAFSDTFEMSPIEQRRLADGGFIYQGDVGSQVRFEPSGLIDIRSTQMASLTLLPRTHRLRGILQNYDLTSSPFDHLRYASDVIEPASVFEHFVNDRYAGREGDLYGTYRQTIGAPDSPLRSDTAPITSYVFCEEIEQRPVDDPIPTGHTKIEIGDSEGVTYRLHTRTVPGLAGVLAELGLNEGFVERLYHYVGGEEVLYRHVKENGSDRTVNKTWYVERAIDAPARITRMNHSSELYLDDDDARLLSGSTSGIVAKGDKTIVQGKQKTEVVGAGSAMSLAQSKAQLHNGAAALTLTGGTAAFSVPLGVPALQLGVPGPPPTPPGSLPSISSPEHEPRSFPEHGQELAGGPAATDQPAGSAPSESGSEGSAGSGASPTISASSNGEKLLIQGGGHPMVHGDTLQDFMLSLTSGLKAAAGTMNGVLPGVGAPLVTLATQLETQYGLLGTATFLSDKSETA